MPRHEGISISGLGRLESLREATYLSAAESRKVTRSAINSTLVLLRNECARMAKYRYNLDKVDLRRDAFIRRATLDRLEGRLSISGGATPLSRFIPGLRSVPRYRGIAPAKRKPSGGIAVKVLRDGAARVHKGPDGETPFIAAVNTHLGIFYRFGPEKNQIRELFGPAAIQAAMLRENMARLQVCADEWLELKLNNLLARMLDKKLGTSR